jgi:MGT family glycosyltransferase
MVVDIVTVAGLDAAEAERVPYIVNNPDLLTFLPPALLPAAYHTPLPFRGTSIHSIGPGRRFLRRVFHPLTNLMTDLVFKDVNKRLNACRQSRGLPPADFRYRLRDKMVMVNSSFGLEYERPLPPLVQMVGPMLSEEIPSLDAEYEEWLSHGLPVVYANLGTIALPPKEQMDRMLSAFRSPEFRVLWILKKEQHALLSPELPSNVRVESWGPPPRAILSHPAVRVFVSHCGINSVHESLQVGTPIVGIPMFADQRDMAMRVQDAGAGLMLDKSRFTPTQLRDCIMRVMNEETFRIPIPAIQSSFRLAGGIKRAADLILFTDHL